MPDKSKELEVAISAALEAGKILEKHQESQIVRGLKEDKSMFSVADTEAEEVIKRIISEAFPEHSFTGEETDAIKKQSEYTWYVDPIDGSRNFAHRIPFFAVSIALVKNEELMLGVVYGPMLRSLYYAEKGKGAYFNDKRMEVSKADRDKSIITVSGSRKASQSLRRNILRDFPEHVVASVRDFACTALDLAFVARGNTEADIKLNFNTYDAAAGILLVREAGGVVTGLEGREWTTLDEGSFIASNGVFHDILVEEVRKQKEKLHL